MQPRPVGALFPLLTKKQVSQVEMVRRMGGVEYRRVGRDATVKKQFEELGAVITAQE